MSAAIEGAQRDSGPPGICRPPKTPPMKFKRRIRLLQPAHRCRRACIASSI